MAVQLSGGTVIIDGIKGRDEKLSLEEAAFLLEKGKIKIKGLSIGDFFSSRRRHTRSCLVSWARRCV